MRKKRKLTETIETDTAELNAKKKKWDNSVISDMEEALKRKKNMLNDITSMLSPLHNKKQKQKVNKMCKRRARKMFEERRV